LAGEDAGGGFADLGRTKRLVDAGQLAVQIGRVAEQQVESDVAGGAGGGLLLDGEAAAFPSQSL
jgi:hypothetical protein